MGVAFIQVLIILTASVLHKMIVNNSAINLRVFVLQILVIDVAVRQKIALLSRICWDADMIILKVKKLRTICIVYESKQEGSALRSTH